MEVPPQLTFRNVERTPDIEAFIQRRLDKLEKFCDHIVSARIAVEKPHESASSGSPYRVRIDLTVPPEHEVVVDKSPRDHDLNQDLKTVLRDAFGAAERQVKELDQRQSRQVKSHEEPRALVVRLFGKEGYGFLKTPQGREIYFHENSVLHDDFDRLEVGTEVRFEETMGEQGPQATTVQIVGKPGSRTERGEEEPEQAKPPETWDDSAAGETED